jgi:hypothetical protein
MVSKHATRSGESECRITGSEDERRVTLQLRTCGAIFADDQNTNLWNSRSISSVSIDIEGQNWNFEKSRGREVSENSRETVSSSKRTLWKCFENLQPQLRRPLPLSYREGVSHP